MSNSSKRRRRHIREYIYGVLPPDSLHLDWSSPNEVKQNPDKFYERQIELIDILEEKKEKFGFSFEKGDYFETAQLLVASNCRYAERVACCGNNRNPWKGNGSCQKWRLCSHCAYVRKQRALKRYLASFDPTQFVVGHLSFVGTLEPKTEADIAQIRPHFRTITKAIADCREEGLISGAYYCDELLLKQFLPLQLTPHSHGIFHLESNDGDQVDLLGTSLAVLMEENADKIGPDRILHPDLKLFPIRDEVRFANALQYSPKAIDLQQPYRSALIQEEYRPEGIQRLNSELLLFLQGWLAATHNVPAIHLIGSMNPSSNDYIGKGWSKEREMDYVQAYYKERKTNRAGEEGGEDVSS